MLVELETLPTVKIVLTNNEAIWLMNFIQNFPGKPEDEPPPGDRYREELFNELRVRLT